MTERRPSSPSRRRGGAGSASRGGRSHRRLVRTVILGTVAVAAGIGWLAVELGMDRGALLDYALTSFLLVLGLVALALIGGGLLWAVKRLRRKR